MKQKFLGTIAISFSLLFLFSCQKDLSSKNTKPNDMAANAKTGKGNLQDKTKTFYGPAVPMGQGVGRAWVTVDAEGIPISIGVNLSAKAVLNQGSELAEYTFKLPGQVAVPPFDHIDLGWNPHGHEPDGIYNLPHFDLHFYMISPAYQASIPFLAPPATDEPLAEKYAPPAYLLTPGLESNMGAHLVDLMAPEFSGGTFSKTFIYGTYKGKMIFLEPMFTLEYLKSLIGTTATPTAIRQPEAYQQSGYYPSSYTISYDTSPKEFIFSLNNLSYKRAQ